MSAVDLNALQEYKAWEVSSKASVAYCLSSRKGKGSEWAVFSSSMEADTR